MTEPEFTNDTTRSDFGRRDFLRVSGYAGLTLAASVGLASCGAGVAAEVAFNPAVDEWFANLGNAVAATQVSNAIDNALKGIWQHWNSGITKIFDNAPDDYYWWDEGWVHRVPPVVMVQTSLGKTSDPMTDRLLAFVNSGNEVVAFDAWAWQALSMFVHDLTVNKSGDDLAGFQALCVISLIPSATASAGHSPEGSVGWMTYQTHNGTVEIAKFQQGDGSTVASLTAYGIPDSSGNPIRKTFTLPTKAA
jgi:hypothetical protein